MNNKKSRPLSADALKAESENEHLLNEQYAEWLRAQRIPDLTREKWAAQFAPHLLPKPPEAV